MVDLRNRRLVDGITKLNTKGKIAYRNIQFIFILQQNTEFKQILHEFIDITKPSEKKVQKQHVEHRIITKGVSVTDKPRRLSPGRRKYAQKEIDKWIQAGDCRPSEGQWASAMHLIKKKTGGWRICRDYRRLNKITIPDKYPTPYL